MSFQTNKQTKPKNLCITFVCYFMPFVCNSYTLKDPLVSKKIPLIEIIRNYKNYNGFTLIELMITLTIIGILGVIAVPSMTNAIRTHRLSSQANELLGDLTFTRSEAIRRATSVTVCKQDAASATPSCDTTNTAAWSAGWIVFIDSNNDGQIDTAPAPGETVLRTRLTLENNNFITSASTPAAGFDNAAVRIRFRNNGTTTIDPAAPAPAGASAAAPTGMARLRLCDSRGVGSALTLELSVMGKLRVNSTRPFDPNTCPTASNW